MSTPFKKDDPGSPKSEHQTLLERAYSLQSPEDARALYRDWATTYDNTMMDGLAYLTPKATAEMLGRHCPDRAARILDIGCGTGLAGAALAQAGYGNLDALDFSPEMLDVARSRGLYTRLIEADLTQSLPVESETYDAAICTGTFTHAHVGADCLDEIFRVLKRRGVFACTVHNDVWEPMGFADKTTTLLASETMRELECRQDRYFETDQTPQGRFIVWQKM